LPDLLLLTSKWPNKNGLEVLRWIREQPTLSGLRVVMLTSSDQARYVNLAYQLGRQFVFGQTGGIRAFVRISQALKGYGCGWPKPLKYRGRREAKETEGVDPGHGTPDPRT